MFSFRSPSPEPIYDQQGKRQNTREVRTRKRIEEQRHQLVTELLLIDPEYKAPGDYKSVLCFSIETFLTKSTIYLIDPNKSKSSRK